MRLSHTLGPRTQRALSSGQRNVQVIAARALSDEAMTRDGKIALVGSGFIGRAVRDAAGEAHVIGIDLRCHGAWQPDHSVASAAERWIKQNPQICERLTGELSGNDVVINAAGSASPNSNRSQVLFDANAVLPAVIATLAAQAGVPRMVHISSAAVQGSRDPLNELLELAPVTPYGESKAASERALTDGSVPVPAEMVIYRPTSVQAPDRPITRQLVKLASAKFLPVVGDGECPLPLCLISNVGAGIVHAATHPDSPRVILQPWEGVTTRLLWELFGHWPGLLAVPRQPVEWAVRAALGLSGLVAGAGAIARRIELLLLGQRQEAVALDRMGFSPPVGLHGYSELADRIRSQ